MEILLSHWQFWQNEKFTELNSTYRISDGLLISYRNQRKFRTSNLTQIARHDLEIPEVGKGLLKKFFWNSLEIDEKVVFDTTNHDTLDKQKA